MSALEICLTFGLDTRVYVPHSLEAALLRHAPLAQSSASARRLCECAAAVLLSIWGNGVSGLECRSYLEAAHEALPLAGQCQFVARAVALPVRLEAMRPQDNHSFTHKT
eukprot:2253611-Amphidinium_carterae.2